MSQRATLIREAQQLATHYSTRTGGLLESLVREGTILNAEKVLELVRRVAHEAGPPADGGWPDAAPEHLQPIA